MSGPPVFSPRVLTGWTIAVALAFACSLYFMTQGSDQDSIDGAGSNTFSRSAVGYAGIAETLQQLGRPVAKSQYGSLAKLGTGSLLIVAEPRLSVRPQVAALLGAKTTLLILPKWRGKPSKQHPGWIADATLVPDIETSLTLWLGAPKAELVRQPTVDNWSENALGITPDIAGPVQLMKSDRLRPLVATEDGILVGEIRNKDRRLWILSDPDVMANHGLGRKDNAAFSVALIDALARGDGAVVFDETVHGFLAQPQTPLNLLVDLKSPFISVTAQAVLAVALLLWAAMVRFGAPTPAPPPLAAGKRGLIRNAAKLIDFAGYQRVIVRRYVDATIRDVGRQLHAPRGLTEGALVEWLQRVGQVRAVGVDYGAIHARAQEIEFGRRRDLSSLLPLVRDIYRWKREIIDGTGGNPRDR
jgi:hypothetical protein